MKGPIREKPDRNVLRRRREFIKCFYAKNYMAFFTVILTTLTASGVSLGISWLLQQAMDAVGGSNRNFSIGELLIICAGLTSCFILAALIERAARPAFTKRAMLQYKNHAFSEISKKSIGSFLNENTSTYISALTNDAKSIETNYLDSSFTLVGELVTLVGALAMMLSYSPLLTIVGVGLSVFPILGSMLTSNRLATAEKELSDQNEGLTGVIKDLLSGFSVIKSFKAEIEAIRLFCRSNEQMEEAGRRRRAAVIVIELFGTVGSIVVQFGVLFFGAYLAISGKGVTAGMLVVFVQLMNYVLKPISDVPLLLAKRRAACSLIDKLSDAVCENSRQGGRQVEIRLSDSIEIKNLCFGYTETEDTLKNINIRFGAGKSYAVVGASGSGKSTLLNILMGGNSKYSGSVLVDGVELRDIMSESLYDIFSIVQQNVFIFNSTIKDNITMYREFDAAAVDRAISLAGLETLDPAATKGIENVLDITINGIKLGTLADFASGTSVLLNGTLIPQESKTSADLKIEIHMQESAGNEYQGAVLPAFDIKIEAAQYTYEADGYGSNQYDVEALPKFGFSKTVNHVAGTETKVIEEAGLTVTVSSAEVTDYVTAVVKTDSVTQTTALTTVALEISVKNSADQAVPATVEYYVGKDLANVKVQHNGVEMTAADYSYDRTTGIVTINCTSYSPYSVTFLTPVQASKFWYYAGVTDWFTGEATEYTLTTPEQLAGVAVIVNEGGSDFSGITLKLGNDIDLSGKIWTAIGNGTRRTAAAADHYFMGTLDGQSHEIKGMDVTRNEENYGAGLFGAVKNVTVKDVAVYGKAANSKDSAAGIAAIVLGEGTSSFTNCKSYVAVSGSAVGGIISRAYGTGTVTITGCENYGVITAASNGKGGGIACINTSTFYIENCKNFAEVTGGIGGTGGILGYGNDKVHITGCTNSGAIGTFADYYAGGIIGYATSGADSTIANCTNSGAIKALLNAGGIAGLGTNMWSITNCSNSAAIAAQGELASAGGIAGGVSSTAVTGCSNTGTVSGTLFAGGVVGGITGQAVIDNCSGGTASVTGTNSGRLVGLIGNGPSVYTKLMINDGNGDSYTGISTVGIGAPRTSWASIEIVSGTLHGDMKQGGNTIVLKFDAGTAWDVLTVPAGGATYQRASNQTVWQKNA